MQIREDFFYSHDKRTKIFYYECKPDTSETKAIVQIVHGMAEHIDRYLNFAEFLTDNGYVVFMHDFISHGKSSESVENLGIFEDKHSDEIILEDILKMNVTAKKLYPDLKLILFGHSMGSFAVRDFAAKYKDRLDKLVVCGTGGSNPLLGVGIVLSKLIRVFKGGNYKSSFLDNLTFGKYDDGYDGKRTKFDWLSKDDKVVDKYIDDPYCGFLFDVNGMLALYELNKVANKANTFSDTENGLEILIISGSDDPVGEFTKGTKFVYDAYKSSGCYKVDMKIYENDRHELLNELDKEVVYKDVLNFIEKGRDVKVK